MVDQRSTIKEGQNHTAMHRVLTRDKTAALQAEVASILLYVYDVDSDTKRTAVATIPVSVSDSIFDTLQTDAEWDHGYPGYNFKHTVGPGVFVNGSSTYRLEYSFQIFDPETDDGAASENLTAIWGVVVEPVYHS